jgi:drug/metabolite transporter (DMT)-like permease
MTYAVLFGSLPVVLLSLPAGLAVRWSEVSPAVWAGTFYASSFRPSWAGSSGAGSTRCAASAGPAPLMYLMPPVAGLVAWALTGESYSAAKIAGAAITLAGVALAQFTSSPRDPVREAPAPVD